MSGNRGSTSKRQRAVPDDRSLLVNSDELRSGFSGIAAFFDAITAERDALKLEVSKLNEQVDELSSRVSSLEFHEEENTRLKNEVELNKISIDTHRQASEQFSEENKRLVLENKRVESLIKRAGQHSTSVEKELAASNLKLNEASGHIDNLKSNLSKSKQELSKSKQDFSKSVEDSKALRTSFLELIRGKDEEIAKKGLELKELEIKVAACETEKGKQLENHTAEVDRLKENIAHLNLHLASLQEEKSRFTQEKTRLSSELASNGRTISALEAKVREAEARIQNSSQDLRARIEELQNDLAASKAETKQANDKLKDVEDIFYDAIQMDNVAISVLLNNGSMVPIPLLYKMWLEAGPMFSGTPTHSIRCNQTSTMATVVHDPAICGFITRVAKSTSLDTKLPSYFRFSVRPADFTGQLVWEEYKLYDQLILMAKLIYMLKQPNYDSRFQVNLNDGHIVTAKYTYNLGTDKSELRFTLAVIADNGTVNKHHIDFVDDPYAVGGTFASKILPGNVRVVNEL